MRIFITGASGFIGGAIARKLAPKHEVWAMARSDKAAQKVAETGAKPVRSALNEVTLDHLDGVNLVIHAAAYVEPWGPEKMFWDLNVGGTQQLAKIAKQAGVKQFIQISSEAAVHNGHHLENVDESAPYALNSPFLYAKTKAASEKWILEANEPGVFETIAIRPRLVWGPRDETIMANLLEMVDKGAFVWVNQGKAKTSTTYIDNLVHGVELAIEKGKGGEAYFITDGKPHTLRVFFTQLIGVAGRKPSTRSLPGGFVRSVAATLEFFWKLFGIKSKPPVPRFSAAIMSREGTINIAKAKRELGYTPPVSVPQGMEILRKWYQENHPGEPKSSK